MGLEPMNVWQWLDERGYLYLPSFGGYQSPCGRFFIINETLYKIPGDVIHFLKTGNARTVAIFDNGFTVPKAKDFGFREHKDGRCVFLRRIK